MTDYIYRVTRQDIYKDYYHQPLVRVVNQRSFSALIKSSREYHRYKIVKVERAPIGDFEDVTGEHVPSVPDGGSDLVRVEDEMPAVRIPGTVLRG